MLNKSKTTRVSGPIPKLRVLNKSKTTRVSSSIPASASASVSESNVETPASSIDLTNVDVVVDVGDILGGGNSQETPPPQPAEATPTPASEVSQTSTPAAPTSTEAAGLPDVGAIVDPVVDPVVGILAIGQPETIPEPTSTDAVESVKQETTEVAKETTETAKGLTDAVKNTTQSANAVIGGLLGRRAFHVDSITNQTSGEVIAINITDLTNSGSDEVVTIDGTCAIALILPHQE